MPLEGTTPIYLFYHVTACIPRFVNQCVQPSSLSLIIMDVTEFVGIRCQS